MSGAGVSTVSTILDALIPASAKQTRPRRFPLHCSGRDNSECTVVTYDKTHVLGIRCVNMENVMPTSDSDSLWAPSLEKEQQRTTIEKQTETETSRAQSRPPTTGHVSSITWPFESPYVISYRCSIGTEPLSLTVFEIFSSNTNVMLTNEQTLTNERTNIPTNTTNRNTSWQR